MRTLRYALIMLLSLASLGFSQQEPGAPSTQPQQNPAFAPVEDNPALPRVLLIGDSISIGYTLPVREQLKGIANVHRIPTNGGPTLRGLEALDEWLGSKKWDVIHFNWGLHDLKIMEDGKHQVPLDAYKTNLQTLVSRLKKTGAKLIWCSTTPVPAEKLNPPRHPQDVIDYNQAALEIMRKEKIAMDDLYTCALPELERIQRPANVHFTDEGSAFLAKHVAKAIQSVLETNP